MAVVEANIDNIIEEIWTKYDQDGNNCLDKDETKEFIENFLKERGAEKELSAEEFEEHFRTLDKDGDGTISREEMRIFLQNSGL
mmetsp:Transcript_36488/g.27054  ORF Transcript_36488/g.27054 Transcript_36488/m.27054 type:complete len:84 (-) Transcript_36488:29-280(-)|eukprot:CAMPEP_0202972192 /NCGR_PEP_ID=MMETSP1396-20130829/34189_1 /ASSEMBLY_ACC=CAM_ASM_000872 /TAXON_ID= /ORGANISM="Pseudokeronopsis sp., Strain Brazil" /LENGTH=83 /DNA_ID=CAMNT_0049702329 /DNA_START=24 /DNA_END=275 /DNA_ORIENTATION=+